MSDQERSRRVRLFLGVSGSRRSRGPLDGKTSGGKEIGRKDEMPGRGPENFERIGSTEKP